MRDELQEKAIELACSTSNRIVGVTGQAGTGKSQPHDARVLTPLGWTTIGKLQSGDKVIAADGVATTVLSIHEQGELDTYIVELIDGTEIECSADHLWLVSTTTGRIREDICKTTDIPFARAKTKHAFPRAIRNVRAVEFAVVEALAIVLDPYIYGLILGDGYLDPTGAVISVGDQDFTETYNNIASKVPCSVYPAHNGVHRIRLPAAVAGWIDREDSYTKHIDRSYMIASIEDRKALLAGLLDTDGSCTRHETKCKIRYNTMSDQLKEDFIALVLSLGGLAESHWNEHNGWTVSVRTMFNPFRLKRKADLWMPPQTVMQRAIVDVRKTGEKKLCRCIKVSHPLELYVTEGYTLTHNTTIMRQVYQAFVDAGHHVALCAPTGKAAKRISEATGISATTIHKLLEYTHPGDPDPKTGKVLGISVPRRGPMRPLDYNIVLGDEYSMVNEELNRNLLDAMPAGGLIRMFGDANQLPPIEEGDFMRRGPRELSPFEKYLKQFPSVVLKNIYRQGEGSGIVKNGHRIINGMCPAQSDDFKVTITAQHKDKIIDYVMSSGIDFASLDNQIITPTNKGWIGTVALNVTIQELLQGDKMFKARVMPRTPWDAKKNMSLMLVEGDKVIWTKNDYQLEIYNGETGIITSLDNDLVTIDFGDRTLGIPPWVEYEGADGRQKGYDPRTQLQLAYVITTHKSQGSEYEHVAYMMDKYAFMLQNRANFYTAITRARKHVHVISDQRSFQGAVTR